MMTIKKKSLIGADPAKQKAVDGGSGTKSAAPAANSKKLVVAKLATAKLSTAKLTMLRRLS